MNDTTQRQGMEAFGLDEDGAGIEFNDFRDAILILIALGGPRSIREIGTLFRVTDEVVRKAVDEAHWLFVIGPDDDPTKQMIEVDGE